MSLQDCVEGGAGTCLNANLVDDLRGQIAALKAEKERNDIVIERLEAACKEHATDRAIWQLVEMYRLSFQRSRDRARQAEADVARLQESGGFWGRAAARMTAQRDDARQEAAARLRAVKRMKRLARKWKQRFNEGIFITVAEGVREP